MPVHVGHERLVSVSFGEAGVFRVSAVGERVPLAWNYQFGRGACVEAAREVDRHDLVVEALDAHVRPQPRR
jgi:hypothetical protein